MRIQRDAQIPATRPPTVSIRVTAANAVGLVQERAARAETGRTQAQQALNATIQLASAERASRERLAARARKADARETKSRDVRLNRALEEVDKYRHMLAEARDAGKGGDASVRRERDELRGEARRLERQKTELVAAFKKQMKLVDVLKKQKIHLEAARAVQFTEEEFMRVLEEEERRE